MTKITIKGWKSFNVEGMEPGAIAGVIEDALIGAKATVTHIKRGPKKKVVTEENKD